MCLFVFTQIRGICKSFRTKITYVASVVGVGAHVDLKREESVKKPFYLPIKVLPLTPMTEYNFSHKSHTRKVSPSYGSAYEPLDSRTE